MKQFFSKYDVGLRLLSLILAFIVWAIVIAEDNPERSPTFPEIKVSLTGENSLEEKRGLSIIEMETNLIDVTVRGPNNEVTDKSMRQRIAATLDVSELTGAGEYDLVPTVSVSRDRVEVLSIEPKTIRVRVDKVTTREVPVRVEATGSPKDGYRAGRPYPTTSADVTIEGPHSELLEVAYAYAQISADGLDSPKKEDCAITLYNEAGEPVSGPHIICRTSKVNVTLPVYKINTIPLTVTLKDGGTVKADQAKVSISPKSIKVIGDKKTISEMGELNLGEFDLGSVKTGVPLEVPITLPDGVRLDEGQPDNAEVTITVDGVATKKLKVTKFALNDTSAETTPYSVEVLTESVEIELRGTENALNQVEEDVFSIGLTFDSVSLGAGKHKVKAVVATTALPAGVTLVEEDVTVELSIIDPENGQTNTGNAEGAVPESGGTGEESVPPDNAAQEPEEEFTEPEPEQSEGKLEEYV